MQQSPFDIAGKNILITGATSGIGRQCATACHALGANVALLGRNEAAMQTLKKELLSGSAVHFFSVDMQDYAGLERAVEAAVQQLGKLHGIIHCAGISTTLPLRMIRPEQVDDFFKTNVTGAIELTRLACKPAHFQEGGGSIIFMGSVMGTVGEAGKTLYSLTKGALTAAAKSLALELARRRIRVNTVSPGVVETPMSQSAVYNSNEEARAKIQALHPLGLGHPDDIANACIYLLSDASRWVTGTNLIIDGGYTAQ